MWRLSAAKYGSSICMLSTKDVCIGREWKIERERGRCEVRILRQTFVVVHYLLHSAETGDMRQRWRHQSTKVPRVENDRAIFAVVINKFATVIGSAMRSRWESTCVNINTKTLYYGSLSLSQIWCLKMEDFRVKPAANGLVMKITGEIDHITVILQKINITGGV